MPKPIDMDRPEWLLACMGGVLRRVDAREKKYKNRNREGRDPGFDGDIIGAIAEAVFAKAYNRYWSCSINSFKLPDVSEWHVRGTRYSQGHLILRPPDRVAMVEGKLDLVAFVTIDEEKMQGTVVGWMHGRECFIPKHWSDEKNGWWIPYDEVHQFNEDGSITEPESEEEETVYYTGPNFQKLVEQYGGYEFVPEEEWEKHNKAVEAEQARLRLLHKPVNR